jgi:hypothetical protein
MTTEEVRKYTEDYRQADDKTTMRVHAIHEYFKWKAIRDGLNAIDMEED